MTGRRSQSQRSEKAAAMNLKQRSKLFGWRRKVSLFAADYNISLFL